MMILKEVWCRRNITIFHKELISSQSGLSLNSCILIRAFRIDVFDIVGHSCCDMSFSTMAHGGEVAKITKAMPYLKHKIL